MVTSVAATIASRSSSVYCMEYACFSLYIFVTFITVFNTDLSFRRYLSFSPKQLSSEAATTKKTVQQENSDTFRFFDRNPRFLLLAMHCFLMRNPFYGSTNFQCLNQGLAYKIRIIWFTSSHFSELSFCLILI